MKKTLLATTLLVATAGLAAAESHSGVSLSGSGRFGVLYSDDGTTSDSMVHTRLRFNIDAKMESDSGVTFGGRIRMQHANGSGYSAVQWDDLNDDDIMTIDELSQVTQNGARLSAAMLYMEANGFRVEVGNANGAYDSAGLMWNSEVGLTDTSYGDPNNTYIGYFSTGPNGQNSMGLFASYSVGDLTARISYHDADQTDGANNDTETSVSLDWSSNGFSLSLAHVDGEDPAATNDTTFVGVAYAIGDSTNVGLNFFSGDAPDLITLYANHTMASGLTLAGYVADQDGEDTAMGVGASYPLGGGAALKASYEERGDESRASAGVSFSF